jgi:hypothetical protein
MIKYRYECALDDRIPGVTQFCVEYWDGPSQESGRPASHGGQRRAGDLHDPQWDQQRHPEPRTIAEGVQVTQAAVAEPSTPTS